MGKVLVTLSDASLGNSGDASIGQLLALLFKQALLLNEWSYGDAVSFYGKGFSSDHFQMSTFPLTSAFGQRPQRGR